MSTIFGDEVRGQSQDANEGIINKPGMEQTYAGMQVSALKDNSTIPVDERQGLFELGSTLSKPFGKLLDDISTDNQDQRAIEAAGRQGMSTAMNQIDQDKKRWGLAEAWGGQSVEYRTAQMIAVENTFEKMHLDDLDTIDQYAELTPQQFLDHRSELMKEYTAPWQDDKEALLKITNKFIHNTRTLVTMQAKEHKAVTEQAIDDGLAERLHVGYAVQTKAVEGAKGNQEALKAVHQNIVKLMSYNSEIQGSEGISEDRFNAAVMQSTVSELEIGNPGPMRGLMQLIKQSPKMMDSKLGKVAMGKVKAAKNAWYADTAAGITQRVKDLEEEGEKNPLKALRDLKSGTVQLYAEDRNLWDGDGDKLVEKAKLAKGEIRGKAFDEYAKNLKLGVKIEGLENRAGRIDLKTVQGLSKKGIEQYGGLISKAAADYGVDEALMFAIVQNESVFNPKAVSPTGAVGLGQLMPATGERFGVRVQDRSIPEENLKGTAKYLRWLTDHFKGDINKVIQGYNAGEGAVEKYAKQGRNVPYPETQGYLGKVLSTYKSVKGSMVQGDLTQEEFELLTPNQQAQAVAIKAQQKLEESKQNAVVSKEHDSGLIRAMEEVRSNYTTLQAAGTLTDEDIEQFKKEVTEMEPWTVDALHRKTTELGKLVTLQTRLQKGAGAQTADINIHNSIELRRAQEVNKEHVGPSVEGNLTGKEMDLQNDFTAAMAVNRIEAKGDGRKLTYAWLSPGKTVDIAGTVGKLVADPVLALKYAQKLDKIGIPPGGKNEVAKAYAMAQIGGVHNMVDKDFRLSPEGKENFTVIAEMLHEKDSSKSTFTAKEFAMLSYVTREVLSGADPRTVMKEWGKIAASPATQKEVTDATGTEIKGVTTQEQLVKMFHHGLGGDPDKMFPESTGEYPVEFGEFVQNYNWLMRAGYDDKDAVDHAKKMLIGQQAVVNGHVVYGSKDIRNLIVDEHGYSLESVLNGSKGLQQVWLTAAGTMQDSYDRKLKDMKPRALGYDPITELLFVEFAGKTQKVSKRALMDFAKTYHAEEQVRKETQAFKNMPDRGFRRALTEAGLFNE